MSQEPLVGVRRRRIPGRPVTGEYGVMGYTKNNWPFLGREIEVGAPEVRFRGAIG